MEIGFRLYLITDTVDNLKSRVEEALIAGVTGVQVRANHLSDNDFLKLSIEMRAITSNCNVPLIINERVDVAKRIGADGIHFKSSSLKRIMPKEINRFIIGFSVHSVDEAILAAEQGADFLTAGPVFETPSKMQYGKPIGLENLKKIIDIGVPVFGLGGINDLNAKAVMDTGAFGLAMISYILHSKNPGERAGNIASLIVNQ